MNKIEIIIKDISEIEGKNQIFIELESKINERNFMILLRLILLNNQGSSLLYFDYKYQPGFIPYFYSCLFLKFEKMDCEKFCESIFDEKGYQTEDTHFIFINKTK